MMMLFLYKFNSYPENILCGWPFFSNQFADSKKAICSNTLFNYHKLVTIEQLLCLPGFSMNLTKERNRMIGLNNTSKLTSLNIQSLSIDNNLTALYNRTIF